MIHLKNLNVTSSIMLAAKEYDNVKNKAIHNAKNRLHFLALDERELFIRSVVNFPIFCSKFHLLT